MTKDFCKVEIFVSKLTRRMVNHRANIFSTDGEVQIKVCITIPNLFPLDNILHLLNNFLMQDKKTETLYQVETTGLPMANFKG